MTDNNDTRRDLVLNVKNFGPIAEAKDIAIKPMTVFVGPSNTGKTYLAILVHAIMSAKKGDILDRRAPKPIGGFGNGEGGTDSFGTLWSEVQRYIFQNLKLPESDTENLRQWYIPWDALSDEGQKIIQQYGAEWLVSLGKLSDESISSFLGVGSIQDLITLFTPDIAQVSIELGDTLNDWHLNISENYPRFDIINLKILTGDVRRFMRGVSDIILNDKQTYSSNEEQGYARFFMSEYLNRSISSNLSSLTDSMYFPAARTGIMINRRILSDQIIKNAHRFGMEEHDIPQYHRLQREFLRYLEYIEEARIRYRLSSLDDPDQDSPLKIADILESYILDGKILISESKYSPPEFYYSYQGASIPMIRASSMVTELMPIILFLRSYIEEGDLLIIEEPEAHLHPAAQQKMAATLALMVRNGLRVLITTHSYDMVEQIGTLVNASHADERHRHGIGLGDPSIEKDVYLIENEVGMYGFTPRDDGSGTDVIPIEIDQDYAYSPKSFSKALSDQFNRNNRFIKARIDAE